ncbi:retron system putative HNH endonuclease [Floridanema aerugineum]|uniref:Retron system putative HNH endonuclease n=1 Tax=Floridaenema aerugineum BLCC-F46 TaxID=3153654 RepID=A0ABV4XCA6_9CYAN
MKYIRKGKEPEEFTNWKNLENDDWKPNWDDNFQAPEKPIVHEALLKEQGYLCCYCGMGINRKNSHIEHLKPRTNYPDLALDYTNLIASCQGESEQPPPQPVHCGHKKRYWYDENLMVSPLDINCENCFRYSGFGDILATNESSKKAAAETSIEKLGLNIPKLTRMRREAIDGILQAVQGLTNEEIKEFAEALEKLDTNGQRTPFCFAITYIINKYLIP